MEASNIFQIWLQGADRTAWMGLVALQEDKTCEGKRWKIFPLGGRAISLFWLLMKIAFDFHDLFLWPDTIPFLWMGIFLNISLTDMCSVRHWSIVKVCLFHLSKYVKINIWSFIKTYRHLGICYVNIQTLAIHPCGFSAQKKRKNLLLPYN